MDADRRFVVGTIAWQKPVEKFTWELWEGDLATPELIKLADTVINSSFYDHVSFKPNSIRQEDASAKLGIQRISQSDLNRNQEYLPLNTGKAVGRIHVIDKLDDTVEIGDNEILVLKELPISLPPVRGIIVAKPSSPLSHINILASGWNIPNVYIKDADKLFREYDTFVYKLDAELSDYKLERASLGDLEDLLRLARSTDPAREPYGKATRTARNDAKKRQHHLRLEICKSRRDGAMEKSPASPCLTALRYRSIGTISSLKTTVSIRRSAS